MDDSHPIAPPDAESMLPRPGDRMDWRIRFIRRLFARIRVGAITVRTSSGASFTATGHLPGPHGILDIARLRVVRRFLIDGEAGFVESYLDEDWDSPDISALLEVAGRNKDLIERELGALHMLEAPMRGLRKLRHRLRSNSRFGSRRNIAAHYDLGNDFYRLWLDPDMTYSAALFDGPDEPLAAAQRRKYLRLAESLDLQPGDKLLEIGCGWGGFAELAARDYGCRVTALTLSAEQARFARDRLSRAGLADCVEVRLQDYRDVTEQFDKIASIEMFEAVGEKYWPVYFAGLRRALLPGGRAAIQTITIDSAGFRTYRRNPDFIQLYIFPGGMLPDRPSLEREIAAAGLHLQDSFHFGDSYARTLRHWERAFLAQRGAIEKLGFDRRFMRMWFYYLRYCELGFAQGYTDVGQYLITRP